MGANGGSILRRDAGEDSSASATFLLCVAAHDPRFRCVVVRDVGKAWNFRFGSDSSRSADAQKLPLLVGLDPFAAAVWL